MQRSIPTAIRQRASLMPARSVAHFSTSDAQRRYQQASSGSSLTGAELPDSVSNRLQTSGYLRPAFRGCCLRLASREPS
jgi:hypothetical protein